MKTKKNNSKTRKLKNLSDGLKINIDWGASDKGYSVFKKKRVVDFVLRSILEGKNLIQTHDGTSFNSRGQTTIHLQSKPYKEWNQTPEWSEILCDEFNDWLKISPCEVGYRTKLFAKLKGNTHGAGFGSYILGIYSGAITETDHKDFVKAMQKTFGNKPIYLHNEDVDWFHIKEYIDSN